MMYSKKIGLLGITCMSLLFAGVVGVANPMKNIITGMTGMFNSKKVVDAEVVDAVAAENLIHPSSKQAEKPKNNKQQRTKLVLPDADQKTAEQDGEFVDVDTIFVDNLSALGEMKDIHDIVKSDHNLTDKARKLAGHESVVVRTLFWNIFMYRVLEDVAEKTLSVEYLQKNKFLSDETTEAQRIKALKKTVCGMANELVKSEQVIIGFGASLDASGVIVLTIPGSNTKVSDQSFAGESFADMLNAEKAEVSFDSVLDTTVSEVCKLIVHIHAFLGQIFEINNLKDDQTGIGADKLKEKFMRFVTQAKVVKVGKTQMTIVECLQQTNKVIAKFIERAINLDMIKAAKALASDNLHPRFEAVAQACVESFKSGAETLQKIDASIRISAQKSKLGVWETLDEDSITKSMKDSLGQIKK